MCTFDFFRVTGKGAAPVHDNSKPKGETTNKNTSPKTNAAGDFSKTVGAKTDLTNDEM